MVSKCNSIYKDIEECGCPDRQKNLYPLITIQKIRVPYIISPLNGLFIIYSIGETFKFYTYNELTKRLKLWLGI